MRLRPRSQWRVRGFFISIVAQPARRALTHSESVELELPMLMERCGNSAFSGNALIRLVITASMSIAVQAAVEAAPYGLLSVSHGGPLLAMWCQPTGGFFVRLGLLAYLGTNAWHTPLCDALPKC